METIPLLDRVRRSCARVAANAQHVTIVRERFDEFLGGLSDRSLDLPELDSASHETGPGEGTAAYVLALDAINFGSGYFEYLQPFELDGKRFEGYFAVASALKNLARRESLTAELLSELSPDDCVRIFAQPHPEIRPLMEHFSAALREFGEYLLQNFDGSFAGLIESADGSAERLAEILIEMSYFRDVLSIHGSTDGDPGDDVYFLKRAQLASADLSLAFQGEGLGGFRDLDRLTIFADNQVPHVLRTDGLLRYSEDLEAKIDARTPLASGSVEETEIRACAVHAVELLAKKLREHGRPTSAMRLDYFLWNRGEADHYRRRPTHLTRSIYY